MMIDITIMSDIKKYGMVTYKRRPKIIVATQIFEPFRIMTKEGIVLGAPRDYIIIGEDGELSLCEEYDFNDLYERL